MPLKHRVVIAVFPDVDLLDVTGPAEVFALANNETGGRAGYEVALAGPAAGQVRTSAGVRIHADLAFDEVTGPLDTLLVPGAVGMTADGGAVALVDPDIVAWIEWIERIAPRTRRVASVCVGAHLLAAAGLLDGRTATTHWSTAAQLAAEHPQVTVDPDPALGDSILVLIDFQNTYRSGVMELEGAEETLAAGGRLLGHARAAGTPVVHVMNDGGEGTPYDIRAQIGAISDEVAPAEGKAVVVKGFPNSFHRTELTEVLTKLGAAPDSGKNLVLAGFMTYMCVNYTAQGAFNLGYRPTVVAEATATRTLMAPDGTVVAAAELQAAALTTITDLFGTVAPTVDALIR
ncbi:isochorismatase family protein [Streptomyces sp. KLOTTS4A1]|uniref:isochorismatase family protein n=1 Tax=Streptomyces sp. KLOTTS4A1 TaxID=3390996 RepID=UPI0039F63354